MGNVMTIRETLTEASARLSAAGIDTPSLDASLLLAETLGANRTGLILACNEPLSGEGYRRFGQLLDRRLSGEPVAYILGRKEFRGLDFKVSPAVLIPRPDTETLVEAALKTVSDTVLDLCTGSGAVAIALKHERPALAVSASDISPEALEVARQNTVNAEPVTFIESDLFAAFPTLPQGAAPRRFGMIVSNPPYVPSAVIPTLSREVRSEPRLALDGGNDGLDLIRRIISEAREFLVPGGLLLLEADPGQMETIGSILAVQGYTGIQTFRDLSQRSRVIGGRGRE
ncbi:MAG: peptide chain release factor N(5)-glutamine methyltransferase [Treponema sp.]|nr:peptide chain release factor N(5)-glutamine methyltransferase [Treponema sp.]